jgi:hypothetical protein
MSTLDLNEAAARAGISVETMCHKMRTRQAPGTKIGRAWVVTTDLFEAWLAGDFKMPRGGYRPDSQTGRTIQRRADVVQRTPSWANHEAIKAVYAECARLTVVTGTQHHVDHIVPLRGLTVSGLHVENNLQILPSFENLSKGRKWS